MLKRPWSHCKYNVPRALNEGETQDKLLPSLIVKDVAEDGGVAEEGVDLEGVGHVEGEELHKDAARRHQHSQASCVEDKVRKALARAIFKFQSRNLVTIILKRNISPSRSPEPLLLT